MNSGQTILLGRMKEWTRSSTKETPSFTRDVKTAIWQSADETMLLGIRFKEEDLNTAKGYPGQQQKLVTF